jgi:hypothetical protein
MIFFLFLLLSCVSSPTPPSPAPVSEALTDCSAAKNTCPDYASSWQAVCPAGSRCVTFINHCTEPVALAYNIGCNGDGKPGAPQCACTSGPTLTANGGSVAWPIVNGDYTSCLPSWEPPCLTASLAVVANPTTSDCTKGTRIEFTAGNQADPYNRFDSYDLDVEKTWYSVPVSFQPVLPCARDHANHDCRPLWCNSADCPDAYQTPTTGGCADGRSPQASCQDTFADSVGYTVAFCPPGCETTGGPCPSCENAAPCTP